MKRNVILSSLTCKCLIISWNYLSLKIIKDRIFKACTAWSHLVKLFLIINYLSTHLNIFIENCLNIYLMSTPVFFLRARLLHGVLYFPSSSYELKSSTQINWNTLPGTYQIWLLWEYIKARQKTNPEKDLGAAPTGIREVEKRFDNRYFYCKTNLQLML